MEPPEPPVMSQRLQDIAHMSQLYAQHGGLQQGGNGRSAAAALGRGPGIHNIMVLACTYKCAKASPGHFAWSGLYSSPDLCGVSLTYLVGLSEYLYEKLGAGKKRLGNQCSTSSNSSSSTSGAGEDACSRGKARKGSSKGPKALSASSFAELPFPPDHGAVVLVGGRRAMEAQVEALKEFYARAIATSSTGGKVLIGPDVVFALCVLGDVAGAFTRNTNSSSTSRGDIRSSSSSSSSSRATTSKVTTNISTTSSSSGATATTCAMTANKSTTTSSSYVASVDRTTTTTEDSSSGSSKAATFFMSPTTLDKSSLTPRSSSHPSSSSTISPSGVAGTTTKIDSGSIGSSGAATTTAYTTSGRNSVNPSTTTSSSSSSTPATTATLTPTGSSSSSSCGLQASSASYTQPISAPVLQLLLELIALLGKLNPECPSLEAAVVALARVVHAAPLEERHAFVSAQGSLQVIWLLSEGGCKAASLAPLLELVEALISGPG